MDFLISSSTFALSEPVAGTLPAGISFVFAPQPAIPAATNRTQTPSRMLRMIAPSNSKTA
jgi:hypothetical protein